MPKFVTLDSSVYIGEDFHIEREIMSKNNIDFEVADILSEDEIIAKVKDADGIAVIVSPITKRVVDSLEKCKVIVRYGIGHENVDIKAATARGIAVCNIPDYCIEEVSTHAMAMILDLCRTITLSDRDCRRGNWNHRYGYPVHRISNLTLGILGFGNTGRKVSHYARAFGMKVVAYGPTVRDDIFREYGAEKVPLETLYRLSDVISIHLPLTADTCHLICRQSLAKMKDGVILINTARGGIVNTEDLAEALESGKVRAVGLDVFEREPLDQDSLLRRYESVVFTPHKSFYSVEAIESLHEKAALTAVDVLNGNYPKNVLNDGVSPPLFKRRVTD